MYETQETKDNGISTYGSDAGATAKQRGGVDDLPCSDSQLHYNETSKQI